MPGSSNEGKSKIVEWVGQIVPTHNKILDIGVGRGAYSWYMRDLENLQNCEWTGIEIWEPYVEAYDLHSRYDTVLVKDARRVDFGFNKYDIAFCGDVLEHMTKQQAQDLVSKLQKCCNLVIISIPIIYYEQGPRKDNPYEIHIKPDWSHEEVMESFDNIIDSETYDVVGIYKIQGLV